MSKKLSIEQQEIVSHLYGHALVKAVPGSGKTTTLIMRVTNLLKQGVNAQRILILMYNKAAQVSFEKKLRVAIKKYDLPYLPEVRTFNSYALKLIQSAYKLNVIKRKTLIHSGDIQYTELLRESYRYAHVTEKSYVDNKEIEKLELDFSNWRLENLTPNDLETDPTYGDVSDNHKRSYRKYCELLELHNLMTFNDSLNSAVDLLRSGALPNPMLQQLIIDEYQDVNYTQNELIKALTSSITSVMVVGDVNQCIYKWRGSRPDFIDGMFEKDFKSTTVYSLSYTFRYGHQLSYIANAVISKNKDLSSSYCLSHPSTKDTEVLVTHTLSFTDIIKKCENTPALGAIAILARANSDLLAPELILQILNLPYKANLTTPTLVCRPEISYFTILLCLAVDGNIDRVRFNSNINKKLLVHNFLKQIDFKLSKGVLKSLVLALLEGEKCFYEALQENVDITQYSNRKALESLQALKAQFKDSNMALVAYKTFLSKGLFSSISIASVIRRESNDQSRGINSIEQLLSTLSININDLLQTLLKPQRHNDIDVRYELTTMHGSKGLEWDTVIIVGLEDAQYPGINDVQTAESENELKEERRLFYVAITRAVKYLYLIVPDDHQLQHWHDKGWSSTPKREVEVTRFVFEMDIMAAKEMVKKIKDPYSKVLTSSRSNNYIKKIGHRV